MEGSESENLGNFGVREVGQFLAGGGDAEAPFVAIQRGQLRGIVTVQVEALETRRAGEAAILFHGDGGVRSRQPSDVAKSAPFVKRRKSAGSGARELQGEEQAGLQGFREVGGGGVVGQADGSGRGGKHA